LGARTVFPVLDYVAALAKVIMANGCYHLAKVLNQLKISTTFFGKQKQQDNRPSNNNFFPLSALAGISPCRNCKKRNNRLVWVLVLHGSFHSRKKTGIGWWA
jgi:hypothetical protein